jgi:predicted PurR-regulated permease PerM
MQEADILLLVISFFATIISVLLIVVGFFLKKVFDQITEVTKSVTELNATMRVYMTKHDAIEKIIDNDINNLKEFKDFVYKEIDKIKGS